MPITPTTPPQFTSTLYPDVVADTMAELEAAANTYLDKYVFVRSTGFLYHVNSKGRIVETFFRGSEAGFQGSTNLVVDNFTTTPEMLAAKQVTLSATPANPLKVQFSVYRGTEQQAGVDFVVTGNILSWNALALEYLLDPGIAFTVRYISA